MNHDRVLIPNHLEGKLITLQEAIDHAQPETNPCPQAPQATRAEREVRDLRSGSHTAGHPARGGRALRCRPVHCGAHLPDGEAGRAGRARGVGAGSAGPVARAGRAAGGAGGDRTAAGHGDRTGRGAAPAPGKIALGLTAGLVPPRVDAEVKAGLLDLVEHAMGEGGWSLRRAAATLGLDHVRLLRWQTRAALDRLADAKPGPAEALHALLAWEREAILALAEEWGEVDRSHRKLAHRGSRLDRVYVSESTVLRVLDAAGMRLPGAAARERRPARPWPEWAELVPGVIWIYDSPTSPPRNAVRSRSPAPCAPTARTTSSTATCSTNCDPASCPTPMSCPCCSPCPTTDRR